jgi:hypothetical protein
LHPGRFSLAPPAGGRERQDRDMCFSANARKPTSRNPSTPNPKFVDENTPCHGMDKITLSFDLLHEA